MAQFSIAEQIAVNQHKDLRNLEQLDTLGSVKQPSDNCCFFYEDINFSNLMTPQGMCVDHPEVQNNRWIDLSAYGWNNGIGSYSCGKNIILKLIHQADTNPMVPWFLESHINGKVSNYDTGLRHLIDDAFMISENGNFLNVFATDDCSGYSYMFGYEWQGGYTQFSSTDLNNVMMIGIDGVNSVMVPAGYQVDLYEDENLGGAHERIYGMHTPDDSMTCVKLDKVHNKLSSFTYGPLQLGKTIGKWEAVQTVNHPIDYEITVGVTKTDSSSTESSASRSFEASMEAGVEFWGVSLKVGLSTSSTSTFKQTVNETTSMAQTMTIGYGCGDLDDGSEMYGLWQWVVGTEDGSYIAKTNHAVCRTDSNALSPPACPWDACSDAECTSCIDGWSA